MRTPGSDVREMPALTAQPLAMGRHQAGVTFD